MIVTNNIYIESPQETVFSYLTDPEKMQKWMGATIERANNQLPLYEVGSVRKVNTGVISFEETITQFNSPNVCEYTVTTGYPFKEYRSRFELKEEGEACTVNWNITLKTEYLVLDKICSFVVNRFTKSALKKLEKHTSQ